ncbi:39144_t:CDS:1, partial [Gigaspora margarita]
VDINEINPYAKSKDNQLVNIIKKVNNSNLIIVNKIKSIDSYDLEGKNYIGQVIYWSHDDKRDNGTVKGTALGFLT